MINSLNPNFKDLPGRRRLYPAYKLMLPALTMGIDISIITPYYNTPALFIETMMSVIGQSLQNWEWIIVDDGSTDTASIEQLVLLVQKDSRIRLIRQDNAGPSAARNNAFSNAHGRYVCLLDSDDMIEPSYLEKCMWFLDSNPEFSFCNSYSVVFGQQEFLLTKGFERNKDYLQANSGPPISVIRYQAYADAGGFDISIHFGHEDWDFWLAMAKAGHWGYTIREYLQWYRKSINGRYEQIMRSGNVNQEFEKFISHKFSGLANNFPNPQRRQPQPFETLETAWSGNNPLQPNHNGRRIMFIVPWMVIGGADRVNLDLIEGLINKGHEITVCATLSANHQWQYKFAELTPDVFVLPDILSFADYPRFLNYLINTRKIDTVVVTGSTIGYQLLPYLRTVSPDTAFIDLSHVEEPHWLNGGHPRFGVGYQDALDLNVVTTLNLVKWMEGRGADPKRIRVMYTGVRSRVSGPNDRDRKAIRQGFGITDGTPIIVFIGRMCAQKRPAFLAQILKKARDANLHFHALIIGDGELRALFETLVDEYNLHSCVQMMGCLPHEQWLEILLGADILLMPSQYEGISVALLEAMAAGVVPVVADVGGQEEVVSEDAGYLIPHSDNELQEYIFALSELIEFSNTLYEKSDACKELMASRYSWEKAIDNFEEIIIDAHQMIKYRYCQFTLPMARELASIALENMRLSDAGNGLWNNSYAIASVREPQYIATNVASVVQLVVFFCQTKIGRFLLSNNIVKSVGRALIARVESFNRS